MKLVRNLSKSYRFRAPLPGGSSGRALLAPFLLLQALVLTSCGPGDTVTVRLITGFESKSSAPNLMEALHASALTEAPACRQKDLRAGYKLLGSREANLTPVPALMRPLPTPTPTPSFNDVMGALVLPEIRLELPRNVPLGVGIIGSITTGGASDFGTCQQFLPGSGSGTTPVPSSIYDSFSVFGTRDFPSGVSTETEIPLKVFVTKGQTEPSGFSTCKPGACPPFVKVFSNATSPLFIRIQHFVGGSPTFEHFFSLSYTQSAFIPKSDAVRIDLLNPSQTIKTWIPCLETTRAVIPLEGRNAPGFKIDLTCTGSVGSPLLYILFPGPTQ